MFPQLQLSSNIGLSACLLLHSYFGESASAPSVESRWCHSPCGFRTSVPSDHLRAGTSHLVQSHLSVSYFSLQESHWLFCHPSLDKACSVHPINSYNFKYQGNYIVILLPFPEKALGSREIAYPFPETFLLTSQWYEREGTCPYLLNPGAQPPKSLKQWPLFNLRTKVTKCMPLSKQDGSTLWAWVLLKLNPCFAFSNLPILLPSRNQNQLGDNKQ